MTDYNTRQDFKAAFKAGFYATPAYNAVNISTMINNERVAEPFLLDEQLMFLCGILPKFWKKEKKKKKKKKREKEVEKEE